ncbi:peptide-methionine (S)-S-oxide reductase [Paenibacillus sp. PAMC21692]|uniref:peptide-methionine (S)-S-oxide reductase MsrA n=1 Tax=Paenibacillus sp. PAMC21692 TaxID=2762320 RepID=UPI0021C33F67|nr:peptide-methionine (S)-S-oxide reductase [Paenibacillus sp. PAMC21692]
MKIVYGSSEVGGMENNLPDNKPLTLPVQSHGDGGRLRTATFGMGCFWSPEALFGALPGVVRTRVGYAGGSRLDPTYRALGDHTETVELLFDEAMITFEDIIRTFWSNHTPLNINGYKGRQYQSLLFYHDVGQKASIDAELEQREKAGLGRPDTEVAPYAGFHLAEDRHQKYYVKRFPSAVSELESLYPSENTEAWTGTTIAARLNGIAKGYLNMGQLRSELESWELEDEERVRLATKLFQIRW